MGATPVTHEESNLDSPKEVIQPTSELNQTHRTELNQYADVLERTGAKFREAKNYEEVKDILLSSSKETDNLNDTLMTQLNNMFPELMLAAMDYDQAPADFEGDK